MVSKISLRTLFIIVTVTVLVLAGVVSAVKIREEHKLRMQSLKTHYQFGGASESQRKKRYDNLFAAIKNLDSGTDELTIGDAMYYAFESGQKFISVHFVGWNPNFQKILFIFPGGSKAVIDLPESELLDLKAQKLAQRGIVYNFSISEDQAKIRESHLSEVSGIQLLFDDGSPASNKAQVLTW